MQHIPAWRCVCGGAWGGVSLQKATPDSSDQRTTSPNSDHAAEQAQGPRLPPAGRCSLQKSELHREPQPLLPQAAPSLSRVRALAGLTFAAALRAG